jgi:hypothetical protein
MTTFIKLLVISRSPILMMQLSGQTIIDTDPQFWNTWHLLSSLEPLF